MRLNAFMFKCAFSGPLGENVTNIAKTISSSEKLIFTWSYGNLSYVICVEKISVTEATTVEPMWKLM